MARASSGYISENCGVTIDRQLCSQRSLSWRKRSILACMYSYSTINGVTQTKLTNHKAERGQYIPTFVTSANEMSSTEPCNFNLFTREAYVE